MKVGLRNQCPFVYSKGGCWCADFARHWQVTPKDCRSGSVRGRNPLLREQCLHQSSSFTLRFAFWWEDRLKPPFTAQKLRTEILYNARIGTLVQIQPESCSSMATYVSEWNNVWAMFSVSLWRATKMLYIVQFLLQKFSYFYFRRATKECHSSC